MRHLSKRAIAVLAVALTLLAPVTGGAQTITALPPAAAPSALPSLSHLFADTLADLRRLPSKDTATILAIGGVAALAGHRGDAGLTRVLGGAAGLGPAFSGGQLLGGVPFQIAGALATYSIGRASGRPAVAAIGADLVRAQIVAQTLTTTLKFAAARTRPDGTQYSFPSGHTASAFATAAVLQRHLGWKAGIPAYGLAGYVAASRIQTKRHYLSDITFGAALGIVAGRTVTIGRGDARFAVAPAAHPGGAGVNFAWIGKQ